LEKIKNEKYFIKNGEKLLFLSSDILSYLKNMQILDILTYILLEPSQIKMLKFASKPVISINKRKSSTNKITWNLDNDNEENEIDIKDFCKGYKEIQTTIKKTKINKKLMTIVNEELDNLID